MFWKPLSTWPYPPLGLLAPGSLTCSAVTAAADALRLAPAWSISLWLLAMAAMTGFVVLGRPEPKLADGMPVVWLSRLIGRPVALPAIGTE